MLLGGTLGYIMIAIGLHEWFRWYITKEFKNDKH
jgi:hypothetical protein